MRARPYRMRLLIGAALACSIGTAHSQTLSGIRVGDDSLVVTGRIGFAPTTMERSGPFTIAKWVLGDRNTLHVAARVSDGKIVYIECDWGGDAAYSDFPGFHFGKTTLRDIHAKLGGAEDEWYTQQRDGSILLKTSYEVDTADRVIVAFGTKIPSSTVRTRAHLKSSEVESIAVLDAIILAEPEYLLDIWGPRARPAHKIAVDLLQPNQQERRPEVGGGGTRAPLVGSAPGKADEVELTDHGGTFLVPVHVNGKLILDFVLDSGASEVQIPDDVFRTLYRTGTVSKADFLGTETYILADGSKVPSDRFMLHTLEVGNHTVNKVTATVGSVNSTLLLGQSFLSKLGSWTLDNERHILVLSDKSATK
jgi:clan AA aspartic protease (TIGR02281 family)